MRDCCAAAGAALQPCGHPVCRACFADAIWDGCRDCGARVRSADLAETQDAVEIKFRGATVRIDASVWTVPDPLAELSRVFGVANARIVAGGRVLDAKRDLRPGGASVQLLGGRASQSSTAPPPVDVAAVVTAEAGRGWRLLLWLWALLQTFVLTLLPTRAGRAAAPPPPPRREPTARPPPPPPAFRAPGEVGPPTVS